MAITIPSVEPIRIRAGNTVKWKRSLSDFPPATHTLMYHLRENSGDGGGHDVTCTNDDGDHLATITRAESQTLKAGLYSWLARVNDGTDYYQIGAGEIEVLPDLEDASLDPRTYAKKTLDSLEEAIAVLAARTHISHSVNGQSYTSADLPTLIDMRDRFRGEVQQETNRAARESGRAVRRRQMRVKFGAPS